MSRENMNVVKALIISFFSISPSLSAVSAQEGSSVLPSTLPGSFQNIPSGVQFCNRSDLDGISLAIMHLTSNGTWESRGYWNLDVGECEVVLSEITNRYIYYHASARGGSWVGELQQCVSQGEAFQYDTSACPDGSRNVGFIELNLEDSDAFTLNLTGG